MAYILTQNKTLFLWAVCIGAALGQAPKDVPLGEKVIDLGVHGTLFEIKEEDMLDYLQNRLKALEISGKLQEIENTLKDKAKEKVINPTPVQGLSETKAERSFLHDPSLAVDNDIYDHEGRIIAYAGQKVNPLKYISLSKGLVFIDGTKDQQLDWALNHHTQYKIVFTNGSPLKRQEQFSVKFYFDQAGILTKRYNIQHIPARLEQEGDMLRITEFVIQQHETKQHEEISR
jgi:conjugal transfer pilus assembly protein TraW